MHGKAPRKLHASSYNRHEYRGAGLVQCAFCGQLYSAYAQHECQEPTHYQVSVDPRQHGCYAVTENGRELAGGFTWQDACAIVDELESAS